MVNKQQQIDVYSKILNTSQNDKDIANAFRKLSKRDPQAALSFTQQSLKSQGENKTTHRVLNIIETLPNEEKGKSLVAAIKELGKTKKEK